MTKVRFIGLDVHADTVAVAVAEPHGEAVNCEDIMLCPYCALAAAFDLKSRQSLDASVRAEREEGAMPLLKGGT